MFLDPGKILLIAVVALVVLGPDQLPKVAKSAGSLWKDFTRWRASIDAQVRGAFPDLPATHEIVAAVRSPVAFLDRLAQESGAARSATAVGPGAESGVADHPRPDSSVIPVADPWDAWPGNHPPSPPVGHGDALPTPVSPGVPIDIVSMN